MGRQKSADGIVGLSTGLKAGTCRIGKESGISMESADTDKQVEIPVTVSDGSGRNPQEYEAGVSRPTARTDNSCPQTMQRMEAVVERENMIAALRRLTALAHGGIPGHHICTHVIQRATLTNLVSSHC